MKKYENFYINGAWIMPEGGQNLEVLNPATEQAFATISLGTAADVDAAVSAARRAFTSFSQTSQTERVEMLRAILARYMARYDEFVEAITLEMGAPIRFSRAEQAEAGEGHLKATIKALESFCADERINNTLITHEPVGVCGLITPWNWPINQVACKVAPAIAAGCTMVLKPSEIAPISSMLFAEVMHEAGVPAGVFNLVNGDGPTVEQPSPRTKGLTWFPLRGRRERAWP